MIKAGRVGVNPEDVNPINGKIQVEAPDNVYTKTQADNKFETKSHASSTYETKADAGQLQPKTLAVPISLLDGSALTVEDALNGLNDIEKEMASVVVGNLTSTYTLEERSILKKQNNVVFGLVSINNVTATAYATLATVPEGFRPPFNYSFMGVASDGSEVGFYVSSAGAVDLLTPVEDKSVRLAFTYMI